MKYFSLFSGVGGFEIGIQNANGDNKSTHISKKSQSEDSKQGWIGDTQEQEVLLRTGKNTPLCIGFSEIDKYANQVLKYRFPETKNYGDIAKINWSEVPDFDLLVGGSPCQDFSIAGKRKGILGERSGLVWEFIRCLEEKKPRYFIWENVKGVMSSRRGFDFANIITAFSESGYNLWWQVLNAKDFGVPQNRERIFVIGFRGECPREVFFEQNNNKQNIEIATGISSTYSKGDNRPSNKSGRTLIIAHPVLQEITKDVSQAMRVFDTGGVGCTLRGLGGGCGAKTGLYAIDPFNRKENGNTWIGKNTRIRRLTPTECERLMSWPDNWTKWGINEKGEKVEMSDTQRYKMCGNGVVSRVVEEIVRQIIF